MKTKKRKLHRMYVLEVGGYVDTPRGTLATLRWMERDQVSLGSMRNPNRIVKSIVFEPNPDVKEGEGEDESE